MSQLNVGLTVKYNGTEVSTGAARNAADLEKLRGATTQQATASAGATKNNTALSASQKGVSQQAHNTAVAVNIVNGSVNQQSVTSSRATVNNQKLAASQSRVGATASASASGVTRLKTANNAQAAASANATAKNRALGTSYTALAASVSGYAAVIAGINFVKGTETSELLSLRIRNLTDSAEQFNQVQNYLEETAGRLNTRYGVLADSYTRLLVLQSQQTVTAQESRDILEGMTNVSRTLGATNTQVTQAMYGMTQAMTQGRVQMQELNQVVEPLPGLLQAMDKAVGAVSGGFRKMVVNGQITSQMFKGILIKALQEYQGAAASTADTINAAKQQFLTAYDLIQRKLQEPVNAAVVPVINAAKAALVLLSDNIDVLDDLATGAVLLAAVLGGRLAASLVSSTTAFVNKTVANHASNQAELAAANAALIRAKAEQQATAGMFASAQSVRTKTALMFQASAASNTYTAAVTRQAAALKAATFAGRGYAGVMALAGGPIGWITIAATALLFFGSSAGAAVEPTNALTQSTKSLREEQEKLNPFSGYTKAAADRALVLYNSQLENAELLLKESRDRVNNNPDSKVALFEFKQSNQDVTELTQKIEFLQAVVGKFANEKPIVVGTATNKRDPIKALEIELGGQEARIQASYEKRLDMLLKANLDEDRFNELHTKIQIDRDASLHGIEQQNREDANRRAREQDDARLRDIERRYEDELAIIQGFKDRKALLEYEAESRIADERNEQQIREAKGFASREQEEDHARQEALLDATARRTGAVRGLLFSQAEWERKNELEKTDSVLAIGEFGFKQMAGQSKKAFAMYKAFSIAKAVINTYEMATGAFNALAPIPIVGPVLGAAAAAAAVAFGLNQVNTIKGQSYDAVYDGGVDYVPKEQTIARLTKGERVVSPRQNVALNKAVDKINDGQSTGGDTYLHYNPIIQPSDSSDAAREQAQEIEEGLWKNFKNRFANEMKSGAGIIYNSVKAA